MPIQYISCAYINAHNPIPIKKGPVKHTYVTEDNNMLSLHGVRTYYYDHPDAPGSAFITVEESECILKDAKIGTPEYSVLWILQHAQNSVKSLQQFREHL